MKNGRGVMQFARVYTLMDFVKCQPLNFKGTGGVVGTVGFVAAICDDMKVFMKLDDGSVIFQERLLIMELIVELDCEETMIRLILLEISRSYSLVY
ncbi:hypothetical protein Tco_1122380 [Tanacetum coccineum]|uniref:Uncharacterized protein n=1 Tax=Tanacetum coccineum TaxID=301880 RepID=A0ABQ5J1T8_9ASTR